MITSQVKKILIESLFMGLQHGMRNEVSPLVSILPAIVDTQEDLILCQALYLIGCREVEAAQTLCKSLPIPAQHKIAALFTS